MSKFFMDEEIREEGEVRELDAFERFMEVAAISDGENQVLRTTEDQAQGRSESLQGGTSRMSAHLGIVRSYHP